LPLLTIYKITHMIIGLGHKARAGKDTAGDYLNVSYLFLKRSFATKLRDSIAATLGINAHGEEFKTTRFPLWGNRTGREILQQYGTDGLRNGFDEDIWVKLALYNDDYEPLYIDPLRVVFTDMRFENEAEEIKKLGGVVIRIDRDDAGLSGNQGKHDSENGLEYYTGWDYILDNNGTVEEFHIGIDTIMEDLGIRSRYEYGRA
jgi:hypothetical protein